MYTPRHFKPQEYIYPDLFFKYQSYGRLHLLPFAMDPDILKTADRLREFMRCPIYINMYSKGVVNSGLRPPINSVGSMTSQHVGGRALDLKFYSAKWNPEKLREYMKSIGCFEDDFDTRDDEEAFPFQLIKRIEWKPDMNWFHMDTFDMNDGTGAIYIFRQ